MKDGGFALELLSDYKKANKRQFIIMIVILIIMIVILIMWFLTIGYLVYTLNDIETVETSTQEITDVESFDNTNIANGDINGYDKAN